MTFPEVGLSGLGWVAVSHVQREEIIHELVL